MWTFRSIDIMHLTKDTMRGQLSTNDMATICGNLKKYGVTHITMVCPLDEYSDYPNPQPTSGYPEKWIAAIRAAGLNVFFRGTWNDFEGNYDQPIATPTGTPSRALGAAATVLNGTDTSSYLYKTWNFIKTHGSYFAKGDAWGPMPEPENRGIGAGTDKMFSSYSVLGQWLVDHYTVANDAFENTLGYASGDILTGMTSVNGGTILSNLTDGTYWSQIGRVCIDHYVTPSQYSSDLDTIHSNSGVDVYFGEIGTTQDVGSPANDSQRASIISNIFSTFYSKSYLKGINYFQAVSGGGTEGLLDGSYATQSASFAVVSDYYHRSYVQRNGNQFKRDNSRFKFIGVNKYPLLVGSTSQANVQAFFDACQGIGINVVRTWAFDTSTSGVLHKVRYPTTGTNLITNNSFETNTSGWGLDGNFTRSNEDAHDGTWSIKQSSASGFQNFTTVNDSNGIAVSENTAYTFRFWYKMSGSGNRPIVNINSGSAFGTQIAAAFPGNVTDWTEVTIPFTTGAGVTKVWFRLFNNNGSVTAYYDDFYLGLQESPILEKKETGYTQLDMILDEARQRNIKLILSLMDNNEFNYNSKHIYSSWANTLYDSGASDTYPYAEFFTDTDMIQLYKDNALDLMTRVNTINGRTYLADDTIFSWELGNEVRINQNDDSGQNSSSATNLDIISKSGSWTDTMSTYIKSIDPNHMVAFGSANNTWQFTDGDTYSNGTYYGVDYTMIGALPNIDYLDFHLYPTQDAGNSALYPSGEKDILSFGNRLLGISAPVRTSGSSVNSKAMTLNAAAQAGDVFSVHIVLTMPDGSVASGVTVTSVTDSASNTYSIDSSTLSNSNHTLTVVASSTHTNAGATSVTATWTGGPCNVSMYLDENSGRDNANNARTQKGLLAQINDWVYQAKQTNNKPIICGETGFSRDVVRSNIHFPLYPRVNAFSLIMSTFYGAGGDGVCLWHGEIADSASYTINIKDYDGTTTNLNWDDTPVQALIRGYAQNFISIVTRNLNKASRLLHSTARVLATLRGVSSLRVGS